MTTVKSGSALETAQGKANKAQFLNNPSRGTTPANCLHNPLWARPAADPSVGIISRTCSPSYTNHHEGWPGCWGASGSSCWAGDASLDLASGCNQEDWEDNSSRWEEQEMMPCTALEHPLVATQEPGMPAAIPASWAAAGRESRTGVHLERGNI